MKDIDLIKLLPELQPAVLHLDDHPGGEPMSRAVMVTYRLSTPPQRARIFDESDRPQGDLLSPTNFPAEGCHEIWVGNNLAGLCSLELTALQSKGETSFHLMLKAIYLAPVHRKTGLCRRLCEVAFEHGMQQVLLLIMTTPDRTTRLFELEADAHLYSLGGQAAIKIIAELLESKVQLITASRGYAVEAHTTTCNF